MVIHPDLTVNQRGRFIRRSDSYFGATHVITSWTFHRVAVQREAWSKAYSQHFIDIGNVTRVCYRLSFGTWLKLERCRTFGS